MADCQCKNAKSASGFRAGRHAPGACRSAIVRCRFRQRLTPVLECPAVFAAATFGTVIIAVRGRTPVLLAPPGGAFFVIHPHLAVLFMTHAVERSGCDDGKANRKSLNRNENEIGAIAQCSDGPSAVSSAGTVSGRDKAHQLPSIKATDSASMIIA